MRSDELNVFILMLLKYSSVVAEHFFVGSVSRRLQYLQTIVTLLVVTVVLLMQGSLLLPLPNK